MNHLRLALIIIVLFAAGLTAFKLLAPGLEDRSQLATTDAKNTRGTIRIGVDGWAGYFPLCSPQMEQRLRQVEFLLECIDDAADYQDRYKKLRDGDYQFAVGTVDSYVLNGEKFDYPGPMVAVIDESKGGDAIVAWKDEIENIDALKNRENYKIAFTPASPSHHLLKAVATHFDIPSLQNKDNQVASDGSELARKTFLDKKAVAAILWEPDVSRALAVDGTTLLLSTKDTQGLIVDVLMANRQIVREQPDVVEAILNQYFKTLQFYRRNPQDLVEDMAKHYDISKKQSHTLLAGVNWIGLQENAQSWFGIRQGNTTAKHFLVDAIESVVDILLQQKDFRESPLPNKDPYRLLNSQFIDTLIKSYYSGQFAKANTGNRAMVFSALSDKQWEGLKPVGTLKVRPIIFASGTEELTEEGKLQVDILVKSLEHYPNFRIEIKGHTGLRGEKQQNLLLSQNRAAAVLNYIQSGQTLADNRARALGRGSEEPLSKIAGESSRAYNYRLPRVEVILVAEQI